MEETLSANLRDKQTNNTSPTSHITVVGKAKLIDAYESGTQILGLIISGPGFP